ncbi:unnamed protein product [Caretta caretta]
MLESLCKETVSIVTIKLEKKGYLGPRSLEAQPRVCYAHGKVEHIGSACSYIRQDIKACSGGQTTGKTTDSVDMDTRCVFWVWKRVCFHKESRCCNGKSRSPRNKNEKEELVFSTNIKVACEIEVVGVIEDLILMHLIYPLTGQRELKDKIAITEIKWADVMTKMCIKQSIKGGEGREGEAVPSTNRKKDGYVEVH